LVWEKSLESSFFDQNHIMLVDSHCHLDYLKDELDEVITNAKNAGVTHLLTVGTCRENAVIVQNICAKYTNVDCSIGVHPLEINQEINAQISLDWLLDESANPYVIAIGETGLDYHYQSDNALLQQENFILHLEAAKTNKLPVIVHTRKARQDTINLLKKTDLPEAGVLHCFTEDYEMAKKALDLGFYISFSGIVTFKNATDLADVASKIPLDRILVETDSPYLAPIPYRGKANLPQYVVEVAKFISNLRNIDYEEFALQTTSNFKQLFTKTRMKIA